ncbi:unnamed protein product [Clonostachys chloroleuca]|uniref:Uncharacterized protein n=1 Tax=Clonostachys chloroleuca TaxID=1926264 RepID=A0AA35QFY2_9HYPO|nr:unnamed protein product [Clonostachys chloroleuca]
MDPVLGFLGIIHLATKLSKRFHEVKIYSGVFEDEIVISCTGLVQAANSLNTAGKNLGTLCSEHIDSPIFKHINRQRPLLEEGRQVIWDMLKWLNRQVKSCKDSWRFMVLWKWKNMKPFFDWLRGQMDFMLLNMLVINSTIELNIVAAYVATHGLESYPCPSHLSVPDHRPSVIQLLLTRASKTLKRNIKDYNRQIKKLQEVERLREGQLPLETRLRSSSQKYMRDSMGMIQTLRKSYTPPAGGFTFVEDLRLRSPSRTTIARPQNSGQEQQEPSLIVDSRHNEDVFSYFIKSGDPTGPTKSVLSQINIRIPRNIISIYKAQELDLPIEELESGDPRKVRYHSSEHRASDWKIVGKTLDVKIYSDSNAHTKPKTLSLFVVDALLDPPIILDQPFLKQSKLSYRNQ